MMMMMMMIDDRRVAMPHAPLAPLRERVLRARAPRQDDMASGGYQQRMSGAQPRQADHSGARSTFQMPAGRHVGVLWLDRPQQLRNWERVCIDSSAPRGRVHLWCKLYTAMVPQSNSD